MVLSKVRYCNNCNQTVAPKKNVSFIVLVLLLLFLILPGIIYLIYCLVQKGKCPICNGTNWRNVGSEDKFTDFQLADLKKKPPFFLCAECNIAFSTAAELYNHNVAKKHSPPKVMEKEEVGAKKYTEEAKIKEEAAKKTYEEELEKQLIEEEEEKKTRVKISPKERLKNSPSIQGALIGVVLVVMLVCIISLSTHQVFHMANDALAPDVNEGDIIKYQKIPLSEIKKNDIIAYIDTTGEMAAKIGKVRSIESSSMNVDGVLGFKTSNNALPQKLNYVPAENFIGKITDVNPSNAGSSMLLLISTPWTVLLMIIVAFVAPIIILQVRKKLQN